ncbi:MAG: peptide-methionine (S)-S-oxide reductase MsrA [Deltaproteobacteria bacterium]|jgi:peptide methionine sulfoxide reductase msrA/msrB|nr:peptide-methionine (S)-S-oxide reductase MsrA [Deltaproteobacteria bacterium]
MKIAYYGLGCFWGAEYYFKKTAGVISTKVGYMGGTVNQPTYQDVCSGRSGHAEVVEVTYDETIIDFETLTRLFFELHDPNQLDRQGPDIGEQYRSVIFYQDQIELKISNDLIQILIRKGNEIATQTVPMKQFYPAEDYHQDYYNKKGGTPYCHRYTKRF